MIDARVFVSIDNLPDDLVPPVKQAIDAWVADRPHVTDLKVVRWTGPAQNDEALNFDRAAEWTRGLYLHSTKVTVGDVAAIRQALDQYAPTTVGATQDSAPV